MINSIRIGDKLRCLVCGKAITISEATMEITFDAELIKCPFCGNVADVQLYHIWGTKIYVEGKEDETTLQD